MAIAISNAGVDYKGIYYTFPEFILVIAVFTKEIGTISGLGGVDFDLIGYPFFILYFLFNFSRVILNPQMPWMLYAYLVISSFASILFFNLNPGGFIKQLLPIVVILSSCFLIINKENLLKIFHGYVQICYYTAIFGIIQVLLSYLGINILIKIPGSLDSISYEPSHYAAILLPALLFSLINYKYYKKEFYGMLIALFFTFNVTGYVVFLLSISIFYVNPITFVFAIPALYYVFFILLPSLNPYFSMRVFDTLAVITGKKSVVSSSLNVNGTTLSFFSNYEVATHSLSMNPITGNGLGGHEEMYYRRFQNSSYRYNYYYGLNAKSAHSLTIRVLSEFGLLGFALYIYTLIRNAFFFSDKVHKAIGIACFSHFLCKTLKLGAYIDYGTPFFFAILILNSKFFSRLGVK